MYFGLATVYNAIGCNVHKASSLKTQTINNKTKILELLKFTFKFQAQCALCATHLIVGPADIFAGIVLCGIADGKRADFAVRAINSSVTATTIFNIVVTIIKIKLYPIRLSIVR